jgi:nucleolar complex protein 2
MGKHVKRDSRFQKNKANLKSVVKARKMKQSSNRRMKEVHEGAKAAERAAKKAANDEPEMKGKKQQQRAGGDDGPDVVDTITDIPILQAEVDDFLRKFVEKAEKNDGKRMEEEEEEDDESDGDGNAKMGEEEEDEDEAARHVEELESLAKTDPDFFKFLQQEDAGLLDFEAEAEDGDDTGRAGAGDGENALPVTVINDWIAAALDPKAPSSRALRRLIEAFRGIVLSDKGVTGRYLVTSAESFDAVVRFVFVDARRSLDLVALTTPAKGEAKVGANSVRAMRGEGESKHAVTDPTAAPCWTTLLLPVASVLLKSLAKFLTTLTDPELAAAAANGVENLATYVQASASATKQLIRGLTGIMLGSSSSLLDVDHAKFAAEGEERSAAKSGLKARIAAYLALRALGDALPDPAYTTIAKNMYLGTLKVCTRGNLANSGTARFLITSLVEYLETRPGEAYTIAFIYIRQAAMVLRKAVLENKTANRNAVMNWQYLTSLRVWAAVAGALARTETGAQLVYPVTQLLLGVLRQAPSSRWLPLRFHTIQVLNDLARAVYPRVIINTLPFTLECLQVPELTKGRSRGNKSDTTQFSMRTKLVASPSALGTRAFADEAIQQVELLLLDNASLLSPHVSFPELVVPIVVTLHRYKKDAYSGDARTTIGALANQIAAASAAVQAKRKLAGLIPARLDDCLTFATPSATDDLPLRKAFAALQKHRTLKDGLAATAPSRVQVKESAKAAKDAARAAKGRKRGASSIVDDEEEDASISVEDDQRPGGAGRGKASGAAKGKKKKERHGKRAAARAAGAGGAEAKKGTGAAAVAPSARPKASHTTRDSRDKVVKLDLANL